MPRPPRNPRIIASWFRMSSEERPVGNNPRYPGLAAFSVCAVARLGDEVDWQCQNCRYYQPFCNDPGQPSHDGPVGYFQACPKCQVEDVLLVGYWSAYIAGSDYTEYEELAQQFTARFGEKLTIEIARAMFGTDLCTPEGEITQVWVGGTEKKARILWRH